MMRALLLGLWACIGGSIAQAELIAPDRDIEDAVRVRAEPAPGAEVIGELPRGQTLPLLETLRHWYRVRLPDGREGFISRRVAAPQPEPQSGPQSGAPPAPELPVPAAAPAPAPVPDALEAQVLAPEQPPAAVLESAAADSSTAIEILDVGSGLAVAVHGANFTLLYDGGTLDDALDERNRLAAHLRQRLPPGAAIDHLVISRPARGHIELLPAVLREHGVTTLWQGGGQAPGCAYRALLAAFQQRAPLHRHAIAQPVGTLWQMFPEQTCHGATLPRVALPARYDEPPDTAPVALGAQVRMEFLFAADAVESALGLRLTLAGRRVLLVGDGAALAALQRCCAAQLPADALVLRGAGLEADALGAFIRAARPQHVVLSLGSLDYGASAGLAPELLAAIPASVKVWRTDRDDAGCLRAPDPQSAYPGGCDAVGIAMTGDELNVRYRPASP